MTIGVVPSAGSASESTVSSPPAFWVVKPVAEAGRMNCTK